MGVIIWIAWTWGIWTALIVWVLAGVWIYCFLRDFGIRIVDGLFKTYEKEIELLVRLMEREANER